MDDAALDQVTRATIAELLAVEAGFPFGPQVEVFKVGGKVFALLGTEGVDDHLTVKCGPEDIDHLVLAFAELTRGYHMNKRHWITVAPGPGIDADLVADLVKNSYELVGRSIPLSRRPQLSPIRFTGDGAQRPGVG